MDLNLKLFDDKNFSDLLKDIYINREEKDMLIRNLIDDIKNLIKKPTDAILLVPLLKEYLDVAVKNDEHLVKMAAIVQRAMSRSSFSGDDDLRLTDDELNDLTNVYDSFMEEIDSNGLTNKKNVKIGEMNDSKQFKTKGED